MERLEKFRDWLIPIDSVVYAEYRKNRKARLGLEDDDSGGTYIYVRAGDSSFLNPIKIGNRNLLDEFKDWLGKFGSRTNLVDGVTWCFPPTFDPSQSVGETVCTTETYRGETKTCKGETYRVGGKKG